MLYMIILSKKRVDEYLSLKALNTLKGLFDDLREGGVIEKLTSRGRLLVLAHFLLRERY